MRNLCLPVELIGDRVAEMFTTADLRWERFFVSVVGFHEKISD